MISSRGIRWWKNKLFLQIDFFPLLILSFRNLHNIKWNKSLDVNEFNHAKFYHQLLRTILECFFISFNFSLSLIWFSISFPLLSRSFYSLIASEFWDKFALFCKRSLGGYLWRYNPKLLKRNEVKFLLNGQFFASPRELNDVEMKYWTTTFSSSLFPTRWRTRETC